MAERKQRTTKAKQPMPEAPSVTLPVQGITHDPVARKRTEKGLWIYHH